MDSKHGPKSFEDKLALCREAVKNSGMFSELCQKLRPYSNEVKKIRCLAIGSFHEEQPARYQLALLLELVEYVPDDVVSVSIYDPVFNEKDERFIEHMGWTVEETVVRDKTGSSDTLFFLPHAPLDLTEKVLVNEKPKFWLANHIIAHTDRYTKVQLNIKYPVMSKLVYVLDNGQQRKIAPAGAQEFVTFVPKRKRRNNNKLKFKQPEINYELIDTHFKNCQVITDFDGGALLKNKPWINSFSDLALQLIE